ncbi:2-oxoacid:acceptor oxidoreductase subunit alpha [Megalodesulfovibrio gigas]|uniref:Putative pyruvate flavodoxin/ferredoxin oxidoreductase domain protein n=1 Tax=Megalodesulfovibrio gigas (strain ATCC 19364 / DSM 1382 / NCIMB 9332 / VKM B-1759) TaxID=1121448 RepID=T2GAA6_MEGG1|nr:2-oxoacid:acceptor oxidoreductase subunit alpha [Megalodesulfovibrio gigas]AGW13530.1 putative pyruvate flavodoxin/ferredoxin oxidoreductase domain protein [Megalodesulfovibrio gigas DSM 1382 = ATCC 19364]
MQLTAATILIGGEAGQGLATVGHLLTKTLVRAGYDVVVTQDYQSRIRGGHNTFAIRTTLPGEGPRVAAPSASVDILVALNQETIDLHTPALTPGGVLLMGQAMSAHDVNALAVPYKELIPKPIFENVAALGVLCGLLGLDRAHPARLVTEQFQKKGQDVIDQNLAVLAKSHDWVEQQPHGFGPLAKAPARGEHLALNGNEAVALGAMAAGCTFCSYYPMTPATSVPMMLAAHAETVGIVVEQAEDEIAAVNMVLGASYAGARAMTATSGGGFALMVEGVSLAGMTETPLVVFLSQRPGPATGLPTRTEQADLTLALYAGHGEFPRAIFAPGTIEQCFHLTVHAFNQAEKAQTAIFVLSDQFLADSVRNVEPFDLAALPPAVLPDRSDDAPESYQRYAVTESGVSPRRLPCAGQSLVVLDSDEHTPDGHITEDLAVRVTMHEKRLRKHALLRTDAIPPDYDGPPTPDLLLACWGSTLGAVQEAAALLRAEGQAVGVLHFTQVWPLNPDHFLPRFAQAGKVVMVEGNHAGQLANCIRMETGFAMTQCITRYDGLPFTARYILDRL